MITHTSLSSFCFSILAVAVLACGIVKLFRVRSETVRLKLLAFATVLVAVGFTISTGSAASGILLVTLMSVSLLPFVHRAALGITPTGSKSAPANAEFSPEQFAQFLSELRAKINATLAGLPPLEQYEASSEMSYGLRALQRTCSDLIEMSEQLSSTATKFVERVNLNAEAAAEAKLLEKGEHIKKTDAEAAAAKAADEREQTVRGALEKETIERGEIAQRREQLVTDKITSQPVAAALADDFFKAEGYDERKAKLTARLTKLAEEKLTAEPFVAEMAAIPLDEAGEKTFNARLESAKSLVTATASRGTTTAPARASLAVPTARQPAETEEPAVFF